MARRVDGMHVWASLCGLDLAGIDSDRSEKKFSLLMSFAIVEIYTINTLQHYFKFNTLTFFERCMNER